MDLEARTRPPTEDDVVHCDHVELAGALRACGLRVDSVIVDAPYSERTHRGHDDGVAGVERVAHWASHSGAAHPSRRAHVAQPERHGGSRRPINYLPWERHDVFAFVDAWREVVRGWWVSLTDHVLAPHWADALEAAGLYVFSPLACVEPGSRVRLVGDGPSQWTTWAVVARPRDGAWLEAWRAERVALDLPRSLSGAHVVEDGDTHSGRRDGARVPGGKALDLMRRLVREYVPAGGVVVDPCCGGGTTLHAARLEGRGAIGCDAALEHVELARERLRAAPTRDKRGTLSLFAEGA